MVEGDLVTFNPSKEISKEIILETLIRHRDALKQARTGEIVSVEGDTINSSSKQLNQVKALNLIISAQREMITISRPIVFFRATQKWKKKQSKDEEKKEHPFNEDENDYNKIKEWLGFLGGCSNAIIQAQKTKRLDDDFLVTKHDHTGEFFELTSNFYEMVEDLESSYEQIYLLMLTNKIISEGIQEDEEMNYKEKEAEAIRRVTEA